MDETPSPPHLRQSADCSWKSLRRDIGRLYASSPVCSYASASVQLLRRCKGKWGRGPAEKGYQTVGNVVGRRETGVLGITTGISPKLKRPSSSEKQRDTDTQTEAATGMNWQETCSTSRFPQPSSSHMSFVTQLSSPLVSSLASLEEITQNRIYRIDAPFNAHKLFIQTTPLLPHGYLIYIEPEDLTYTELAVSEVEHLGEVADIVLLGTVSSPNLGSLLKLCRENPEPDSRTDPPAERMDELIKKGRTWVRHTIDILKHDSIIELKPPPGPGHALPRHHHTQYCSHQRLYIHHPYRRRSRGILYENQVLSASATILPRD
ncbi:hypothetical protein G7046_g260 [Stylonectria norvegica]|nr:hypothetical protein G7046_g260 [Stylonectria norvegica]